MTDMNEHLDEDILAHIADAVQGQQTAFSALYALFSSKVYRLCYSLLLNAQDAEDVTQEAFVYAFRNIARYDKQKSAFKTWLYTIAVSRCRNMYRRQSVFSLDFSQILQLNLVAPAEETPERAVVQQGVREAIVDALTQLSPVLREAVVLRYGQGLCYREIADIMGCPPKTAESRVRLAHKQLYQLLQPMGESLLQDLFQMS